MIVISDALGWAQHRIEETVARLAAVHRRAVSVRHGDYPSQKQKAEAVHRLEGRLAVLQELEEGLTSQAEITAKQEAAADD